MNVGQIPGPTRRAVIEREQILLNQRGKKLNDEKWIAGSFPMHQCRQWSRAVAVTADRVRNQMDNMFASEGCEDDILHLRSSASDPIKCPYEGMGRGDLVVTI